MYNLRFVSVDSIRLEQDMVEEVETYKQINCDWFVLQFEPGREKVFLSVWNYKDEGPQVVMQQYEQIEEFEFIDLKTGDKFGLNAFNDLFWKLKK